MNINKLKQYWYPISRSQDLKTAPKSVKLFGEALVLARLKQDNQAVVRCFEDVCPHRLVPLSQGKIKSGRLQCGYHGWEFDATGELQCIPGLPTNKDEPHEIYREKQTNLCPEQKAYLNAYPCVEQDGWIWVKFAKASETNLETILTTNSDKPLKVFASCAEQSGFDRLMVYRTYKGEFIHAIENFLDPVHTAFLHRGIIRSAGIQHMRYKQTRTETGFVGHFRMMNQQNGLVNRLFDPGVNVNISTFSLPSHVTIEFMVDEDKVYEISWYFVPVDKGVVGMATNIYIPTSKVPAWVKFNLMRPLIEYAFLQDKDILSHQVNGVFKAIEKRKAQLRTTKNSQLNDCQTVDSQTVDNIHKVQEVDGVKDSIYKSSPADMVIDHLLHYLADAPEGIYKEGDMILDVD